MRLSARTISALAEMICGAAGGFSPSFSWANFRYRSSSALSEFFSNCDLEYEHDGSTRKLWVIQVLEELNQLPADHGSLPSGALLRVVQELLDPMDFRQDGSDRMAALKDLNVALSRDGLEAYLDASSRCRIRQCGNDGVAAPSLSLHGFLRNRDIGSVHDEFDRALRAVETDPPAAATAACSILEAIFKVYIGDRHLEIPRKQTIKRLWSTVADDLGFTPRTLMDDDLIRIVSGLSSIVDGVAALRTHTGSAHGHGRKRYRLRPRHARLTVHAAHTLATFVLESWDESKKSS